MEKLTVLAIMVILSLQVYQVYAASMIFDTDTTITTNEVINNGEIRIIGDDVTVTLNNTITNYGIIVIKGNLLNNNIINNFGIIINNDTLVNTNRITNYGTIINNGIMNNTYILNNLNIINNTGIINNQGYIYNFGNIHNNTGIGNDKDMLAIFPGIVSGQINNEGFIIELNDSSNTSATISSIICSITLSDNMINQGGSITATVNSNANAVLFEWIDPSGNVQRSVTDNDAPFSDTYTPNIHGEWTVKATCNGISDDDTFILNFNVLPESPIGAIVIIGASTSILVAYMYRKIH